MNDRPFNQPHQFQPADTSIGRQTHGNLGWVTNQELDTLVTLLDQVLKPASMMLSKNKAIEFASKAHAENLILVQRHARLQQVLVAFKLQMQGLNEEDPLRKTYEQIFETFRKILEAK